MNFSLFDIFRIATKKSILLGVGDAIETLGMPADESSKDKILGFLKDNSENEVPVRRITGGTAPSSQKKLGRSLNDIAAKEAS